MGPVPVKAPHIDLASPFSIRFAVVDGLTGISFLVFKFVGFGFVSSLNSSSRNVTDFERFFCKVKFDELFV